MAKRRKPSKKKNTKKIDQRIIYAVIALVLIVAAFFVFGGKPTADTPSDGLPADISTEAGYEKIQEGAFLLDVRTPEEWVEYHVDGATLIPLDELQARASEVPFDQEVIVMCNSGNRSTIGRDILLSVGHPSVASINGGIQAWMKAGYPTVSGE